MTVEYGYRGSLDVGSGRIPNVDSTGAPIFSAAGGRWASELVSSDGKYRFLKTGYATGRGAGNVFDAALADNFTVLMLARTSYGNSYPTLIYKGSTVAGVAGWRLRSRPVSSNGSGAYWSDSVSNQEMQFPDNGKKTKDRQWHWWSAAVSGATASLGLDGNFVARARTATDLSNTSNLMIGQTGEHVAVVLLYSRLLPDAEVASICAGTTRPTDVSGCIGYYKFNETHGSSSGSECTDYSGQGNHLTYSGAGWEVFDPTLTTAANFANGHPYVAPQVLDAAQWWNKQPFAIATPEAQGMVLNGNVSVPYNALMNLTGDLSYGGWIFPRRLRTTGTLTVLSSPYNTSHGPVAVSLQNGGKRVSVSIGNTSSGSSTAFDLAKPIPLNKSTFLYVTLSGNQLSLYLNGLLIGIQTNSSAHGNPSFSWSIFDTAASAVTGGRSIRLFSRAITAAEVLGLFLTDQIANRAGLVAEWMCNTPHSTVLADSSGNGLNGTLSGSKVIDSPYQATRLNRTGKQLKLANGNYASFSSAALRSLLVGASVITVSAWVKMTRGQMSAYPIFGLFTSAGNALAYISNGPSGFIYTFARESEVASLMQLTSSLKWQEFLGRYVLVSAEVDYPNDTLRLYINGKLHATASVSFAASAYSDAGNPSIQLKANTSELHVLDACRIWNLALTAQEHYDLFRDITPSNGGLVAEYLFDDDTTSCLDSSGNGFHATWAGGLSASNYVQES